MLARLSFKNPRRGKQPRAHILLRLYRMARRKRVAYARAQLVSTLAYAQRQAARFEALAVKHDVPIDAMPQLPPIPTLPGREWVEYLQDMRDLKEPVKPAPPIEGIPA